MDRDCELAAQELARFDPLAALRLVALRNDADALVLRGVALAQLGEYADAERLLRKVPQTPRIRAARGEIALAARDLGRAGKLLVPDGLDRENALHVRLLGIRRLLLLGRVDEAARVKLALKGASPRLRAFAELLACDIARRKLEPLAARAAIARARTANAKIEPLDVEIERLARELEAPVAVRVKNGERTPMTLADVAALVRSKSIVVDACRRRVGATDLTKRPVLFALAETLAERGSATREALVLRAFGARRINDSLRARLRVEIGRLRRILPIEATPEGFALVDTHVVLLAPPSPGEAAAVLALLRDGEAWSTSALAGALGTGQRAVQRALEKLEDAVTPIGKGPSKRWTLRPVESGIASGLLLLPKHGPR